jgi:Interferon-induced transmembrane protein
MSEQWNPPPPRGVTTPPAGNSLALAIVATVISVIFCCLPHGVVSLIFALQVDKKAKAGDVVGAINAAKQAKMWAIISLVVSIVFLVIGIVFGILNAVLSHL